MPSAEETNGLLDEGDTVSINQGKETFAPFDRESFEVGAIGVMTRVRKGESGAQAAARARGMSAILFRAEFELKMREFFERREEVRKR